MSKHLIAILVSILISLPVNAMPEGQWLYIGNVRKEKNRYSIFLNAEKKQEGALTHVWWSAALLNGFTQIHSSLVDCVNQGMLTKQVIYADANGEIISTTEINRTEKTSSDPVIKEVVKVICEL